MEIPRNVIAFDGLLRDVLLPYLRLPPYEIVRRLDKADEMFRFYVARGVLIMDATPLMIVAWRDVDEMADRRDRFEPYVKGLLAKLQEARDLVISRVDGEDIPSAIAEEQEPNELLQARCPGWYMTMTGTSDDGLVLEARNQITGQAFTIPVTATEKTSSLSGGRPAFVGMLNRYVDEFVKTIQEYESNIPFVASDGSVASFQPTAKQMEFMSAGRRAGKSQFLKNLAYVQGQQWIRPGELPGVDAGAVSGPWMGLSRDAAWYDENDPSPVVNLDKPALMPRPARGYFED